MHKFYKFIWLVYNVELKEGIEFELFSFSKQLLIKNDKKLNIFENIIVYNIKMYSIYIFI